MGQTGREPPTGHYWKFPVLSGPFWICTTLVFAIAISGNLSNFLVHLGKPDYKYTPEFRKGMCCCSVSRLNFFSTFFWETTLCLLCFAVSIAATAIFSYAWLVPLGLWGFLLWRNNKVMSFVSYTFMETVCVYGYSLAIYIPAVVRYFIETALLIIPPSTARLTAFDYFYLVKNILITVLYWACIYYLDRFHCDISPES